MITIKSKKEIEILKEGGAKLASVLNMIIAHIEPGASTGDLEKLARKLISDAGGRPSFLGYKSKFDAKPYPTALCISINDEVVHAPTLPPRILRDGDIVGIDLGMEYPHNKNSKPSKLKLNGLFTDIAATVKVGDITDEAKKLIAVTKKSLELAVAAARPGRTINDIARAIQAHVEAEGFSVVRDLVGHGVGYGVHEDPQVFNFVIDGKEGEVKLRPGMVLAIEPMVNAGSHQIVADEDGFTIRTADGSLSAHFEHSVVITKNGCQILTS